MSPLPADVELYDPSCNNNRGSRGTQEWPPKNERYLMTDIHFEYHEVHRHEIIPWPSPFHVDTCPRSRGPNQQKTWPAGQAIWPAGHSLGRLVSGICTLPPQVRYIPGVTIILVEFKISL
jgi:hypothetical protein